MYNNANDKLKNIMLEEAMEIINNVKEVCNSMSQAIGTAARKVCKAENALLEKVSKVAHSAFNEVISPKMQKKIQEKFSSIKAEVSKLTNAVACSAKPVMKKIATVFQSIAKPFESAFSSMGTVALRMEGKIQKAFSSCLTYMTPLRRLAGEFQGKVKRLALQFTKSQILASIFASSTKTQKLQAEKAKEKAVSNATVAEKNVKTLTQETGGSNNKR